MKMNDVTESLLEIVSDYAGSFEGAYSVREDGGCTGCRSTEHIKIDQKAGLPGLDIHVKEGTKGETVSIPACVTKSGVDDQVYNDFYIGKDADIVIMAGCGVHNDGTDEARHNGIHRFFLEEGARVKYIEKHVGTGNGTGSRVIDPVSEITMQKGSYLEMDTTQIGGVQHTVRETSAKLAEDAKLVIRERLFTSGSERAETVFKVELDGDGSGADIVSRSVAKDESYQSYESTIVGNAACTGHSECDSIIAGQAIVDASPRLFARNEEASLIHEAAIGKIAGDQILKLRTLGLTEEEAENKIIEGFLA